MKSTSVTMYSEVLNRITVSSTFCAFHDTFGVLKSSTMAGRSRIQASQKYLQTRSSVLLQCGIGHYLFRAMQSMQCECGVSSLNCAVGSVGCGVCSV